MQQTKQKIVMTKFVINSIIVRVCGKWLTGEFASYPAEISIFTDKSALRRLQ